MCFSCGWAIFSLPTAGLFSCSRLRGTKGARPNTKAQVRPLAEVRDLCSGGSKSQVTTERHSEHVEPSRPIQTYVQVKTNVQLVATQAHVISRILNVVRHYLVMEMYFPDTNLRDMRPLSVIQKDNLHDIWRIVSSHARSGTYDRSMIGPSVRA